MRIKLTSIMVDDQDKALRFYTDVLGFVPKQNIPVGGPYRWLTVVSPEAPDDTELSLEPNADADADGTGVDRGLLGHLRQPDSAVPAGPTMKSDAGVGATCC
jgi:catechol 2,3-dioxygenase-like lactoylglutathione lyase family enzyme